MKRYWFFTFFVFAVSSGCTVDRYRESFTHPYSAKIINDTKIVGEKYLFFSDNQKSLITTEPVLEQSEFSEKSVNTAHRRAALDAFSLDIVKYITEETGDYNLIIHGGDILNNSCTIEFDSVVHVLNETKKPWFIAPGNHDGYYFGITSPRGISKKFGSIKNIFLDERAGWALSCTPLAKKKEIMLKRLSKGEECDPEFGRGFFAGYECYQSYVMDKVSFIHSYLRAIGVKREILKNDAVSETIEPLVDLEYQGYNLHCVDFEKSNSGLFKGYLSNVCWTQHQDISSHGGSPFNWFIKKWALVDNYENQWLEKKPWRNFVIQKLKIPNGSDYSNIIILDTSSYSSGQGIRDGSGWAVVDTLGAADRGHLSGPQRRIIKKWVSKDEKTLLVGHHPLVDFDDKSLELIQKVFKENKIMMYISGDTHDGYDAFHQGLDGEYNIREANLGSTIDAPIEYAIGGFYNNNFILKRRSLTPTKSINDSGTLKRKYKDRDDPPSKKYYATFDDRLWLDVCSASFEEYVPRRTPKEPLGLETVSPLSKYRLKGMFLLIPFYNQIEGYHSNLYAYKINRLIGLVEVYRKLYRYSNMNIPIEVLRKEREVEESIIESIEKYFSEYFTKDSMYGGQYYATLIDISELVDMLEEGAPNNSLAKEFKLCSALYEAEREYKEGYYEKYIQLKNRIF